MHFGDQKISLTNFLNYEFNWFNTLLLLTSLTTCTYIITQIENIQNSSLYIVLYIFIGISGLTAIIILFRHLYYRQIDSHSYKYFQIIKKMEKKAKNTG